MIKYAIFDMDGTLLDSMPAWNDLDKKYLESKGMEVPSNISEVTKTMSMVQSSQYFHDVLGIEDAPEKIMEDINSMIEDEYFHEMPLKPYVKEYLEKLHKENIPMCIATATPSYLAEAAMKRLNVRDYFEFIICCDEVGTGKDKPDVFYKAAERLGAKPEETEVYDDAEFALICAGRAGFRTVGVYDSSSEKSPEEMKKICQRYIMSFKDVL